MYVELLLLAVNPAVQSKGIGTALTRSVEAMLTQGSILLAETSGLAEFNAARFYALG